MRGERSGRRNPDPEVKAAALGADQNKSDGPGTLKALGDLLGVVARSNAPQLPWRVAGALLLAPAGKAPGVAPPLMPGAALTRPAERPAPGGRPPVPVGYDITAPRTHRANLSWPPASPHWW